MSNQNPYGVREKAATVKAIVEKKTAYESLDPDFLPQQKTASVAPARNPFDGLQIPVRN